VNLLAFSVNIIMTAVVIDVPLAELQGVHLALKNWLNKSKVYLCEIWPSVE